TVRLGGGAQAESSGAIANLGLGEMTDREQRSAQLALREHVDDVALILRRIGTAMYEVPISDDVDSGVMARGDRIEPQEVGALAEAMELQVPVAFDARIRRQAVAMRSHVRIDDMGVEVVGEVEHEVI